MRFSAAMALCLVFTGCRSTPEPGGGTPAASADSVGMLDEPLRTELLRLGLMDRTIRTGFAPATVNDTAFVRASLAMDSALTRRLRTIVIEHGWPTRSMVGDDAAEAAALILTHSPVDAIQREMLPRLDSATAIGEASAGHAAALTDRIRTIDGKPQLYGTQFRIVAGALVPYPIEEPDQLDRRRAEAGLMPMEDYVEILRGTYAGPVLWPATSVADPQPPAGPPPDTSRQSSV